MNWERWARASGIGFVVLIVVSFVVFGEQPKLDAQANEIADFCDGDRRRILTAVPLLAVAFVLFLWFVGPIANALREAGEGRLGATTVALGAVFAGVQRTGRGTDSGPRAASTAGSRSSPASRGF